MSFTGRRGGGVEARTLNQKKDGEGGRLKPSAVLRMSSIQRVTELKAQRSVVKF